jgi:hypothetical protein
MAKRTVSTFTTTIDRSTKAVFDDIADVSKHAEWSPKPFRGARSAAVAEALARARIAASRRVRSPARPVGWIDR